MNIVALIVLFPLFLELAFGMARMSDIGESRRSWVHVELSLFNRNVFDSTVGVRQAVDLCGITLS
jgi:hypothetical protein